jgi:chromosome segregation ATPase
MKSKHLVRGGVIATLGLGAALVVVGPDRIRALFTQTQTVVNDAIDARIKDPVALRQQIRTLAEQYPRRIADVRGDLAQLKVQQAQLQRDLQIANRVVEMADADFEKLSLALGHANATAIQNVSLRSDAPGAEAEPQAGIVIVFKNERLSIEQAQNKSGQVVATRAAYASRAADIQRDLGYLTRQEQQLGQLLGKLEQEQMSFNTQMFDLDRQIDAIGRNDRMIAIMSDRQKTLDEQSRYRAASLDQITSKLADIRARQEAQLGSLGKLQDRTAYEDAAKATLDRETATAAAQKARQPQQPKAHVIEINPDKLPPLPAVTPGAPAAPTVTPTAADGRVSMRTD